MKYDEKCDRYSYRFQDIAGRGIDATGFELIKQQVETKKLGEELPIVDGSISLGRPCRDDFYAETVNTATAGHWDLIKIMTCGNYMPVAYGADYEFSTNPQKWDGVFHSHPITRPRTPASSECSTRRTTRSPPRSPSTGALSTPTKARNRCSRRCSTRCRGYRSFPRR